MNGAYRGTGSGHHTMPARIRAALGPTNTGKTHYALTRMMAHASGIIGFPLRLLARENYERLVSAKGVREVALITGEEKIVPPGARWFSCTVEAMPLNRKVEFVAIDEIQLAADPDRGHVFTDRMLHARGAVETLFLGAETIRPLLQRLVPGIEIDIRERLSCLVSTGATKLSRLPPRTAIVAFSAAEVYALAEVIRRRRGGCAVIMGQLSPRTRNAQVELYQNREVDYLVATDAIGMGLNMDVDHVALAALGKFDGTAPRPLHPQEVAQIAGRAGRGMKDGTFGTTADCPPMSQSLVEAVEQHRFDPIERIYWRNHGLDFSNPRALLSSLTQRSPHPGLTQGRVASDVTTLETLVLDPDIRDAARGRRATELLWEVCQIPDFRKIGDDSHARLCARLYLHILKDGAVPANWMEGHIRGFARIDGDIDTLMHRLTGVRVCSYVAARTEWSRHAAQWQARAREVEDMLSDALHERLTARFVDRRATTLLRRLDTDGDRNLLSAVTQEGDVIVEGHPIGRIEGFTLRPDVDTGADQRIVLKAGRRALLQEIPRRIAMLEQAPDSAFRLDEAGRITWGGIFIARLVAGHGVFHPDVELLPGEFADTRQRDRVSERLRGFVRRHVEATFRPLFAANQAVATDPVLRGVLHRLTEDGGITPATAPDHLIGRKAGAALRRLGVTVGRFFIFCPALLKPAPLALLTLLTALRDRTTLEVPPPGRVSIARAAGTGLPGWIALGPIALRLDVAEKIMNDITRLTVHGARPAPANLASRMGAPADAVLPILHDMHIAYHPPGVAHPRYAGPPAPLMLLRPRRLKPSRAHGTPRPPRARNDADASPFAALKHWKENVQA